MPTHTACRKALTPALLASLAILMVSERTHAQAPAAPAAQAPAPTPAAPGPQPFEQEIPGAAMRITLVPIPGDESKGIKPFFITTTELVWPAFDPFVYRLDDPSAPPPGQAGADATTRPSKPYLPPDRGFGHDGYAAISMSFHSAEMYCKWLSEKSGKKYRLPTETEWEHAAGGSHNALPADASLADFAWYSDNADGKPHPVGTKHANAHGLHDMLGNVQEWCIGVDGKPVTKGGSYRDPADRLTTTHRAPLSSAWNASDPQMPKSKWWLSDGPFVGFRVVCEPE